MKTRSATAKEKRPFPTSDVETHVYIDPKNIKAYREMNEVKRKLEINGELEVYPSIHHPTFSHADYKTTCKELLKVLADPRSNWCDGVSLDYVKDTFEGEEHLMLIVVKHRGVLLGFSAINVYADRMNLEIICTNNNYKGVGTYMNTLINDIAVDIDVESIGLEAVTTAVGFYLKVGYECVDDLCAMEKSIVKRSRDQTMRKVNTKTVGKPIGKPIGKLTAKRPRSLEPAETGKRSRSQTAEETVKRPRTTKAMAKSLAKTAKVPRSRIQKAPRSRADIPPLPPADEITYL
jgi:hypothetical protein